ncbi:MAG TPA: hypothetical protein VKR56_03565 [Candidatus Cybelea sp.]|nr:hypothetical protein [Candidatus Cybelea sp.]
MKRVLAFLLDITTNRAARGKAAFHDDTLRANQGSKPAYTFSYWRSLVS